MISFLVPEIFKFSYDTNLVTDGVIGCASTVLRHKINNISANNEAMLLKLGRDVARHEIYLMVHILILLWQHVRFQSLSSSKSSITICSCTWQKYTKSVNEETQWRVGLGYILDRTRYFALFSRKW